MIGLNLFFFKFQGEADNPKINAVYVMRGSMDGMYPQYCDLKQYHYINIVTLL